MSNRLNVKPPLRMTNRVPRTRSAGGATPTLADVAARAGVSSATVSRVLNGVDVVSANLRMAVRDAVSELGYVPHGAARALATRRSGIIGAVVPTVDNAIFAGCIEALQRALADAGRTLLLASSDYDPVREAQQIHSFIEHGIDALMLVGGLRDAAVYSVLEKNAIPYVITWVHRAAGAHPCIGFDNEVAGYFIACHLLELGHREFAMVSGIRAGNDRAQARVRGVRRALAAARLSLAPGRLLEQRYTIAGGRAAAARLLELATPPSAIICGNDVLALGALFECQARGLAVPGDVSVTGIDDSELAANVAPALTTLSVPAREMGRAAAGYLLARLAGEAPAGRLELPVTLVSRGTTGPVRSGV